MKQFVQHIFEKKYTEASEDLSAAIPSIMEKKLYEMKKAVAAKMCEQMGRLGLSRADKLKSGVLEAADPKEDSTTVERGMPAQPQNTTVIHKSPEKNTTVVPKNNLREAVTVKKKDYSWGKMITVHHGNKVSYPLHPEHQEKIANLKHDGKITFKDETGSIVTAHRDNDTIHLSKNKHNEKTSVAYSHFAKDINEEEQLDEARIAIVKARIRGGKIQRRKKVSNVPGMTIRGGQLKRMSAAERRARKMGARRGKVKRMAKMSRAIMKRKRSLQKRKSLGL